MRRTSGISSIRNRALLILGPVSLLSVSVHYVSAATHHHSEPSHKAYAKKEPVVLNFVNADLDNVVQIIAKLTGRNFLLDPKIKGTLSLVSLKPVPEQAVYPLFLAALRQQGFAAIDLPGGVTKIVLESDSRAQPVPVLRIGQKAPIGQSQLYTYVYPLEYEPAAAMIAALRPLMTANSVMSSLPDSNSIIVTDYAENIRKLQQIIEVLDRPAGEPKIFQLKYVAAGDIANMLNKLLSETPVTPTPGAAATNTHVNIVADTRTNSLLVRSDNLARKAQVQSWIEKLDVPTATPSNLHIVYLKNAEAARVAALLRNVFGIEGGGNEPSSSSTSLPTQPGGTTTPTTTSTTTTSRIAPSSSSAENTSNINGINVYADTVNNALLVLAPETLFINIRHVIDQMDIRRAQVYIEALVVEMSADKAAEFGIQWQSLDGVNKSGVQVIGGTNFGTRGTGSNILDPTQNLGSIGGGLNIGVVNGSVTLPGIGQITNLGLLARALESYTHANILSTPTLMTLDNEEARIVIGENVPFITGQYTQNSSGTTTPFQTIDRKDVGLTLKVKPQITEGGSVKLTLYQEVSSVQDTTNAAGIITNKRSIESTVLVNDNQTIVLGGLMQDTLGNATNKVPLLGDLPILGSLFRYDTQKHSKTNLMIFMRPTIVRSAESTEQLSLDRYHYLINNDKASPSLKDQTLPENLPTKPFSKTPPSVPTDKTGPFSLPINN